MTATPTPLPRLFVSVADAAKILGISRTFAYELVAAGEIPTKQFGSRKLVPIAALERMATDAADEVAS